MLEVPEQALDGPPLALGLLNLQAGLDKLCA